MQKTILTIEEMKQQMEKENQIHGFVRIHLSEVIDNDLEGFLDIISEQLTGSPFLMNISYNVDHTEADDLILYVSGDASDIILENE